MQKKRIDKKMLMLMVPALACSLAAGVPQANALPDHIDQDYGVSSGNIVYITPPLQGGALPYSLEGGDSLTVDAGGQIYAYNTDAATPVVEIHAVNVLSTATGVTISNSGLISVKDFGAIFVEDGAKVTSFENAGTIEATNNSTATIHFSGIFDGSLTNSGLISANVEGYTEQGGEEGWGGDHDLAGTAGVGMSALTGNFTNVAATASNEERGKIEVSVNALNNGGSIEAFGAGIFVGTGETEHVNGSGTSPTTTYNLVLTGGEISGTLANNGLIDVHVSASMGPHVTAKAIGVFAGSVVEGGELTNSGNIHASASAGYGDTAKAYAAGIVLDSLSGTLVNGGEISSGTTAIAALEVPSSNIDVYAQADNAKKASAEAVGIDFTGVTLAGEMYNNGSISAEAIAQSATAANAYAAGIYVEDDVAETLENNGTISAYATAKALISEETTESAVATAIAIGLDVGSVSGQLLPL